MNEIKEEKNKNVYIVLTYTGTVLSKIIKLYTKSEFSHASLSLDENLNEMYSFGRLNAYNPFIGGFVHENIKWGTFKRFNKTKAAIYSLKLTEKQYQIIKDTIIEIKKDKEKYKFNLIGLIAIAIKLDIKRNKKFYCAEFIKYLLELANIELDLPKLIKPNDFQYLTELELEYKGTLSSYDLLEL